MERLSAEGRFFHRGCFRCQYCSTNLRLGSYMFDKDGKYGHRFYCSQHYGMQGQIKGQKIVRKSIGHRNGHKTPEKVATVSGITVVDVIDRGIVDSLCYMEELDGPVVKALVCQSRVAEFESMSWQIKFIKINT